MTQLMQKGSLLLLAVAASLILAFRRHNGIMLGRAGALHGGGSRGVRAGAAHARQGPATGDGRPPHGAYQNVPAEPGTGGNCVEKVESDIEILARTIDGRKLPIQDFRKLHGIASMADSPITSREKDFAAWYQDVVLAGDMAEPAEIVKGCMVIKPNGYAVWEILQRELDNRFKATGHQNIYLPLLIPQSFLEKEAEHVEGFAPELAVVTIAGGKKLEEPYVIRPTSETIVGPLLREVDSELSRPAPAGQSMGQHHPLGIAHAHVSAHHGVPLAGGPHRALQSRRRRWRRFCACWTCTPRWPRM
jgi:hypothetical protein